ncbi:MAG: ATP synthase F1 subunit delta, partial [Candidatus Acidiferrales bacterium]
RYAAALADVATERKNSVAIRSELAAFAGAYRESADLRNFLASPAIGRDAKQGLIEKLAVRMGLSEPVRNFIFLLVDNKRIAIVDEMRQAFDAELNAREGIAEAKVTSARELSATEKNELIVALERLTSKRITAQYTLNASLVGGAVVQIGSTIYDGSVREQLNRLRAQLEAE